MASIYYNDWYEPKQIITNRRIHFLKILTPPYTIFSQEAIFCWLLHIYRVKYKVFILGEKKWKVHLGIADVTIMLQWKDSELLVKGH